MIRVVVENVVLFLLPTAIYFAYRYMAMGEDRSASGAMDDAPLFGLFAAGALVVDQRFWCCSARPMAESLGRSTSRRWLQGRPHPARPYRIGRLA